MAETAKPTTPSKESLLKHLAQVEQESINNVAGKTGFNPFLWANKNVAPLVKELKELKGDASTELAAKVLAIKPLVAPPTPAAK